MNRWVKRLFIVMAVAMMLVLSLELWRQKRSFLPPQPTPVTFPPPAPDSLCSQKDRPKVRPEQPLPPPEVKSQKKLSVAGPPLPKKKRSKRLKHKGLQFDIYIASTQKQKMRFVLRDGQKRLFRNAGNLKKAIRNSGQQLVFATNGGMFHASRQPVGLFIEAGKQVTPIERSVDKPGNFFMQPNGIFFLSKNGKAGICITADFKAKTGVTYATQSGPMLVTDGKVNRLFGKQSPNRRIRNGVGIKPDGDVVFAISKKPVTFYELATLFTEQFDCSEALYLDGEISKMYAPEIGRNELGGELGVLISISEPLNQNSKNDED